MAHAFSTKSVWAPAILIGLGAITVASAQTSNSPFASKSKTKAWETVPTPATSPQPAPLPQGYQPGTYQAPTYQAPSSSYTAPQTTPQAPSYQSFESAPSAGSAYNYQPQSAPAPSYDFTPQPQPTPVYGGTDAQLAGGAYYPNGAQPAGSTYTQQPATTQSGASPYGQRSYNQGQYTQGQYNQGQYTQGQYNPGQQAQGVSYPNRPRSWKEKLGLDRLITSFKGGARVGAAATTRSGLNDDDVAADFIADSYAEFEVSSITQGGLEYGFNVEARAQYDEGRRGFGGRVGDCPAANPDCASVLVAGVDTPIRGHTTQFYTDGPSNEQDAEFAVEGAYLFLRSAYGDVTLGRDDGAAYLFSLGAPTLLAVGASNTPVDYTGLDSVKTVNDASGFAEKITYTSPRLLGDQIGVGVQFGASYAPNARACGVDYCVRSNGNDGTGVLAPDLDDVVEFGLALDRKFASGVEVEVTGTYARASEQTNLAAFDDLSAFNAGIEISLADWTVGGSWLNSNNALDDGDYTAWDIGLTWKPSALGFTLGYGEADDDNIDLSSSQVVAGVSYEFDKFTLGTGVQYIDRDVPVVTGGVRNLESERAAALFIEGGFRF